MLLTIAHRPAAAARRACGHVFPVTAVAIADAPARAPARRLAMSMALLMCVVAGCSETSLNEAPIVDLSAQSRIAAVKPPPMAIPAAPGETLYTVKKGDTLFHLASNAGVRMQDLARWNGIDEHAPIFVGQQMRLQAPSGSADAGGNGTDLPPPGAQADSGATAEAVAVPIPLGGGSGVEVRPLDAPPGAATAPVTTAAASVGSAALPLPSATPVAPGGASMASPPVAALPQAAAVPEPATAAPGGSGISTAGWIWPTSGAVTGNFDATRKGIEIAAAEDAPVVAVADGTVSYVGSPRDYGNLIILKHSEDLLSVYAHNKSLLVKEGQVVRRGQTIATAGKSPGIPATLHFEVRRNHVPIDPLGVLPLR